MNLDIIRENKDLKRDLREVNQKLKDCNRIKNMEAKESRDIIHDFTKKIAILENVFIYIII